MCTVKESKTKEAERRRHPFQPSPSNQIHSTPSHSLISFSQHNAITGSLQRDPSPLVWTCWVQTVSKDEPNGGTMGGNRFLEYISSTSLSLAALLVRTKDNLFDSFWSRGSHSSLRPLNGSLLLHQRLGWSLLVRHKSWRLPLAPHEELMMIWLLPNF